MASQESSRSHCESHAIQRSLYKHALNALRLASYSECASDDAREIAKRCEQMLHAADGGIAQSAMSAK